MPLIVQALWPTTRRRGGTERGIPLPKGTYAIHAQIHGTYKLP